MKLQKFSKSNTKRRKIIIACSIIVCMLIAGFAIFKTYAFYQEDKTYNVLEGKVGDFGYDIKVLSVVVDDEKSETIPARGLYSTDVECTSGTGTWDYNAWALVLEDVESSSKCNVTFTSNLTQEEYDEYIEAGKALRRNTYRGKDITGYHTDGTLYTMISNGTFDDIYVGDYIVANNVTWLVADIDNYLYTGDTSLTKHHLTMIPAKRLTTSSMNSTDTTEGGYYGSEMVTTTLPSVLSTYVIPAFGDHVLTYRNLLTNAISATASTASGAGWVGSSNSWAWYDRQIDLMSEANVYGTTAFSSSGYDTGIDNRQYAIFQLKPELINSDGSTRFGYWLKNVSRSTCFALVHSRGASSGVGGASDVSLGVRPRFLIG